MSKVIKIPSSCGKCNFIGHYETGPYARNPHCCCELIWKLKHEDYRVSKDTLDENCPLKVLASLKDDLFSTENESSD